MKVIKKSLPLILIIIGLILIIWVLFNLDTPLERWQLHMQNRDYEEAACLLSEFNDTSNEIIFDEIANAVNMIKADYVAQTLSYADALAQLSTLKSMNCNIVLVADTIDYVNRLNDSAIAFNNAEQKFKLQEYKESILLYKQVDKEDINFSKAIEGMQKALSEYRKLTISEIDTLQDSHSYNDAITKTEEAILAIVEDSVLEEYKNNIYHNAILYYEKLSSDSQTSQDYLQAINYLETAASYDINKEKNYDEQINTLYNDYFNLYLLQADAIFQSPQDDYAEAAAILKPVLDSFPYAMSVRTKYNYYLSYQPTNLFEIEPFQTSTYFTKSPVTGRLDNRGNEHDYMYICGGLYDMDADWKLGCKYDLLTGTVGVPNGDYDSNVKGKIQIYGDGILLWEKTGINASTAPETIQVNVTGVDVLQIRMVGGIGPLSNCSVMIADFKVQKTKR